jgi:predicted cupin superfamily sugar epimerase
VSESAGGSATEQAGAQPGDLAGLPAEAARWVRHLGLEPLEHEGGLFRRMHLDEHSSAIYYLLADPDFDAGQLPQLVVPPGVMQGSSPLGPWSLIGTTMAPPFEWQGFELGDRDLLQRRHPDAAERIAELTRAVSDTSSGSAH